MDIKDVQKLITEKKDNVLIPMVQSMSENFAKSFETGVEVGIEIGKAISPDYSKVWHKSSEMPEFNREILAIGKAYNNPLILSSNSDWVKREITMWAYIEDLLPK